MNNPKTGWIVAGILAVVVVVLISMMWAEHQRQTHDIGFLLQQGKEDVSAARDRVNVACSGAKSGTAACKSELDNLAQVLEDFSAKVAQASSTASSSSGY